MAEPPGKATCHLKWEGDDIKGATCQPQDMVVWEGIELIGCPRGTGKICNIVQGVIYTVLTISDTEMILEMRAEYACKPRDDSDCIEEAAPNRVRVALEDVPAVLRLTFSQCYYTCQGRSFDRGRQTFLLDTEHPRFNRRALIVGMSRVRHGDDLHVAEADYSACTTGRLRNTFRRI